MSAMHFHCNIHDRKKNFVQKKVKNPVMCGKKISVQMALGGNYNHLVLFFFFYHHWILNIEGKDVK